MAAGSVAKAALDDKTNMNAAQNYSSVFDSSGWNVNVGQGASQSSTADRSNALLGTSQMLRNPLVLVALCMALYYITKKK